MSIHPTRRTLVRGRAAALVTTAMVTSLVVPTAAFSDVVPSWSVDTDGGVLGNDTVEFVRAAQNTDRDETEPFHNGGNTIYVAGTAYQNDLDPLRTDRDVLVSAYDATTGELVWDTRHDCGLHRAMELTQVTTIFNPDKFATSTSVCQLPGTDDELVHFDIAGNNNVGYLTTNVGGRVRFDRVSLWTGDVTLGTAQNNGPIEIVGTHANETALSWGGGAATIVGRRDGKYWAGAHEAAGNAPVFDHAVVAGEAFAAANVREYLGSDATITAGMQNSSSNGDLRVALYGNRTGRTPGFRWADTWIGAAGGRDVGVEAAQGHVGGIGWMSFVAGISYSPVARSWDVVVLGYDNATGARVWEDVIDANLDLTWPAQHDFADTPIHLEYNRDLDRLVLAGSFDRGTSDGEDVLVRSYDAATGRVIASAFAQGDMPGNADDRSLDLAVSRDGQRVFVLAELANFTHTGGDVAKVLAFDADLRPAGQSLVDAGYSGVPAGGIDVMLGYQQDPDVVVGTKATSALGDTDQRVQRLPQADFVVQTIATVLSITDETPSSVTAGDPVVVQAKLLEESGDPIEGASITIGFGPTSTTAVTDAAGLASSTFDTDGLDGTYAVTADFAGQGVLLPSQATSSIEVARLATSLEFTDATTTSAEVGDDVVVEVRLQDQDTAPVVDVWVDVQFGNAAGSARTNADGTARLTFPTDGLEAGVHDVVADFAGNGRHEASNAGTTISLEVPEPDFVASAVATQKGVTLSATANSDDVETATVSFDVDWFRDERPGDGRGAKEREAEGVRALAVVVEQFVDEAWIEVHRVERSDIRMFAAAGTEVGPDWVVEFEAVDVAGTYRVSVTGILLDADGSDLKGRGVEVTTILS